AFLPTNSRQANPTCAKPIQPAPSQSNLRQANPTFIFNELPSGNSPFFTFTFPFPTIGSSVPMDSEVPTPEAIPEVTALTAQSIQPRAGGLWRDLRDAIRGTSMDYTQGSIGRAILLLAIPMMLEMAMESTFAVVDIFFVSSLGAAAVATVGLTESILTLVYAGAIGVWVGTTAPGARRIGGENPTERSRAACQQVPA